MTTEIPPYLLSVMHLYLGSSQGGMNVGGSTFQFPIAFPNATLSVQGIVHSNGSDDGNWYPYLMIGSVTQQSATIWSDYGGRTWLVIGY